MEKKKNFVESNNVNVVLSEGLVEDDEEDSREDKNDESGVVKIQRSESD